MLRRLIPLFCSKNISFSPSNQSNIPLLRFQSLRSLYSSNKKSSSSKQDHSNEEPIKTESKESSNDQQRDTKELDNSTDKSQSTSLHEMEQKMRTLQDAYLQQLADMENLRIRTKKEVENASHFSINSFSKDLLSVVDILEIALKTAPSELPSEQIDQHQSIYGNLHEGIQLTLAELVNVLKRHNIEKFTPLHERFDPNLHNALYQVSREDFEPGIVVSVEKSGYMLKGRLLRPASVGVSTK